MAPGSYQLAQCDEYAYSTLTVRDCQFWSGGMFVSSALTGQASVLTFANNLFYRDNLSFYCWMNSELNGTFRNNTLLGGAFSDSTSVGAWSIRDNLFSFYGTNKLGIMGNHAFNAYIGTNVNASAFSPLRTTNDVLLTDFTFASGPLGDFYHSSTNLVDRGSTNANQVSLYHFTTQISQVKETNSVVDIGFHYVACDSNGNPIDTDGDGVPDYLEDVNGNGIESDDPTSWQLYNSANGLSIGDGLRVFTPLH